MITTVKRYKIEPEYLNPLTLEYEEGTDVAVLRTPTAAIPMLGSERIQSMIDALVDVRMTVFGVESEDRFKAEQHES